MSYLSPGPGQVCSSRGRKPVRWCYITWALPHTRSIYSCMYLSSNRRSRMGIMRRSSQRNGFNPAKLTLTRSRPSSSALSRTRLPRHKVGEKFLRGPVPWDWVLIAAKLPGKALHVGIALWHYAGLTNCSVVRLSVSRLREMGVRRWSAYRALKVLEGAGLTSVDRGPGRSPIVTLNDAQEPPETG